MLLLIITFRSPAASFKQSPDQMMGQSNPGCDNIVHYRQKVFNWKQFFTSHACVWVSIITSVISLAYDLDPKNSNEITPAKH